MEQWFKKSVVYQIYPRSFYDSNNDGIGDLKGIEEKLPYLRELGIDVIWLSPIYESPNDDNGYDISDYRSIMKEFGSMKDFDSLLKSAHSLNIKIMMDLVVNHTSDEHKWFIESKKSIDNKYRDYYIWKKGKGTNPPNNWGSCFSGSAWEYDENTDMYYLHLFSKKQPDLNWENQNVRKEVFDMMDWWCEKGIDGFRMDVISYISKDQDYSDTEPMKNGFGSFKEHVANGPRVHEFLQEMNRKVLSKYDLITVGECAGVTVDEALKYANLRGTELNMVFQFEHMDLDGGESFKWNNKKIDLIELKKVLSRWQEKLHNKAWNSLYWCNHDQPRIISRLGSTDRYYKESGKMLGTVIHFMEGTPYIYQGEEIGMTNCVFNSVDELRDIESINAYNEFVGKNFFSPEEMLDYINKKGRDNARTPMQWNNSEYSGFSKVKPWIKVNENYKTINVENSLRDKDSIFYYYKKLIELRHNLDVIVYGKYSLILEDDKNIFAYTREYNNEKITVLCNFSDKEVIYSKDILKGNEEILISNYKDSSIGLLRPFESVVYFQK